MKFDHILAELLTIKVFKATKIPKIFLVSNKKWDLWRIPELPEGVQELRTNLGHVAEVEWVLLDALATQFGALKQSKGGLRFVA